MCRCTHAARPELKDRNFFVTGESYAGHYIPAFSHHVWRTNRRKPEGDRMRCDVPTCPSASRPFAALHSEALSLHA